MTPLYWCFSYSGTPNPNIWEWFHTWKAENNHFPQFLHHILIHTAQSVTGLFWFQSTQLLRPLAPGCWPVSAELFLSSSAAVCITVGLCLSEVHGLSLLNSLGLCHPFLPVVQVPLTVSRTVWPVDHNRDRAVFLTGEAAPRVPCQFLGHSKRTLRFWNMSREGQQGSWRI